MNRVTRGTVVLAAALGVLSCKGDPTSDLRNGIDHLIATPTALYVGNQTTQNVIVEAVDEQGNRLGANFSLGTVGAGITVVEDDSFNLVYNNKGELVQPDNPTRFRFRVTADQYVTSQFVVNAGGKSITIPVRTEPATLVSNVSNLTPALGDTVTIDAPPGLSFDPAGSVVTFGATATHLVSRTATQIRFVPPPSAGGPASVSRVSLDYAPAAGLFTVPTAQSLTVPPIPDFAATPTGAIAIGDIVTITMPAPFKFIAASSNVVVATATPGVNAALRIASVSADSSIVTVQVGPAANDTIRITGARMSGASTLGTFLMRGPAAVLSSPAITTVGTFNVANAQVTDTVTLTLTNPALRFRRPGSTVNFAVGLTSVPGIVVSIAADSLSMQVLAPPGADSATVNNLLLTAAPLITGINLKANNTMVVAGTSFTGTDDPTTAPNILIPAAVGDSIEFFDVWDPALIDQFYTFDIPAGTKNYTFTTNWDGGADIDALRCPSTAPDCSAGIGSLGATSAHPEVATLDLGNTASRSGIQKLWINLYAGSPPTWVRVKIKRNS